ncbi:MAG: Trigger factor [Pseudomonadota bacterium]|jgi:trigger factor
MDFQSSVVDIDEVTKQISVTVPQERVAEAYETSVKSVGKKAHMKGFRPGKMPRQMVERLMGDRIRYDVANRLIDEGLRGAFKQHNLEVVGEPEVELKEIEPAKALEFTAKVALYPQPTIANYLNRSVQVTKRVVGEKEVAEALERLLESRAEPKEITDRKIAEKGDVVALGVAIQVDGGEFSRPEPLIDELGAGKIPHDVEAQVAGMAVGDEKEFAGVGPDNHANPDVAGKNLVYRMVLHGLFAKNMPELTDDFVKTLGFEVETVEALKSKIQEELTEKADEDLKNDEQSALLDLLVKENPFKVPQVLVDEEIRGIVSRYGNGRRDVDPSLIDIAPFRSQFEELALSRIRCAIIIDRIGSTEGIQVEESDRNKMIERIAAQNGSTPEATRKMVHNRDRVMSFLLEVRRTKILEHLMAHTTVQYVDGTKAEQDEKPEMRAE